MRIEKVLTYHFTPQEKSSMILNGIINGCGGKGANFDDKLKIAISNLPGYDKNKSQKLYTDLREICFEHDYDYFFQHGFHSANFNMAVKVYNLLDWAGWKRIIVATTLFLLLTRYGRKYYGSNR